MAAHCIQFKAGFKAAHINIKCPSIQGKRGNQLMYMPPLT
jgi:hypothetical protein